MKSLRILTLLALAATALAATPALTPPIEAEPEGGQVAYALERTTTEETSFVVDVSAARTSGQETFIAFVGLNGTGADLSVHPALMTYGSGDPLGAAYVAGERVGCPDPGCGAINQVGVLGATAEYDSETDDQSIDRLLIVAESETPVRIDVQADGWQLRRLDDAPFVTVRQEDVDGAVSLQVAGTGYETFTSAQAAVDYASSIAVADLPCAGVAGTAFGPSFGEATLDGGREPVTATCQFEASPPVGAVADTATEWTFEGAAVGSTTQTETRLLVVATPATPGCSSSAYVNCVELP